MKSLFKIFALLFGLSQTTQTIYKDTFIVKAEKEAERKAMAAFYNNDEMTKSEFIRHMYNTKNIICL